MPIVYLGLGSNKGNRLYYIERALEEISSLRDTQVLRVSSVFETEPWGIKDQSEFLNCTAEISTRLEVSDLVTKIKVIERLVGRTNSSKWHEREIDIDLLFYSDLVMNSETIRVPHAELCNRNFVLIPLNELAPDFIHPVYGKSVSQILSESSDRLGVKAFGNVSSSVNNSRIPQPE
jgi:2-amino-4-hydroxy-6-hydroxymethyldihydropteridine diphosphokinase